MLFYLLFFFFFFFFFKQKTAYEMRTCLEFRRVLFRSATYFVDQDEVVFDDTAPAMEVELAETLTPSSVLVNTADTYRFSGVGAIAGSTGLVKSGSRSEERRVGKEGRYRGARED